MTAPNAPHSLIVIGLLLASASVAAEPVPTWLGFPVYPPEAVARAGAAAKAKDRLCVALPDQEADERALIALKDRGGDVEPLLQRILAAPQKVARYWEEHAAALGWKVLDRANRGGSNDEKLSWAFGRLEGGVPRVITIEVPAAASPEELRETKTVPRGWGELCYVVEKVQVTMRDGFPVACGKGKVLGRKRNRDGETIKVECHDSGKGAPWWDRLPTLYGWTLLRAQSLDSGFLFERRGRVVRVAEDGEPTYTFVRPLLARRLADFWSAWGRGRLSFDDGLVVADGRPLKRPYLLERRGAYLTVNGVPIEVVGDLSEHDLLERLNSVARDFRELHCVFLVSRGSHRTMCGDHTAGVPRKFEQRVSAVVASPAPPAEKRALLRKVVWENWVGDDLLGEILRNWSTPR